MKAAERRLIAPPASVAARCAANQGGCCHRKADQKLAPVNLHAAARSVGAAP
jgi:hypothetical protein